MGWFSGESYLIARLLFQRGLAFIYLLAFLVAFNQFRPLLGERGLLPVPNFLRQAGASFWETPSIFHFGYSDRFLGGVAVAGIILSVLALTGISEKGPLWGSIATWGLLYILYLSIVNVGQTFYAFGWESMLVEAGFYAVFLGTKKIAPAFLVIFLLRWMLFRTEFGAGMIKMRGDSCWRDLTCLDYHYETQPMPNPLSWYIHHLPQEWHHLSVLVSHFAQLIAIWGLFLPQPIAAIAGLFVVGTQLWLMLTGNYSFLNLLTIVLAFSAFSDQTLVKFLPVSLPSVLAPPNFFSAVIVMVAGLVAILSIFPIKNFLSKRMLMNYNYNPLHLVGSYGAFGSVTKERFEVVIEGTQEPTIREGTSWKEYEFKGKPGDVKQMPRQWAPYHLRLDWLMWFLALDGPNTPPYYYNSWFLPLTEKLLVNDQSTLSLLAGNPFPERPPKFIRALLYRYKYTDWETRQLTKAWWERKLVGIYLPPVALKDHE